MVTLQGLMKDYFATLNERRFVINEGLPRDVPIVVKKAEWKQTTDKAALIRTYEFESGAHLKAFIDQLLAMQERIGHHADILIEEKSVRIRVGTRALSRITELDIEYAKEADQIYGETADGEQ